MSESSAILTALETISEANKQAHEDIRKSMEVGLKAIQITIDANALVSNNKMAEINDHLLRQDSNIVELQTESNVRKKDVEDFRSLKEKIVWYKKKWFYWFIALVIVVLIIIIIYDNIGIRPILKLILDKI